MSMNRNSTIGAPGSKATHTFIASMNQKVVLVVEDDRDLASIYRNLLEHSGYRVLSVTTAESALELVEARGGRVDLVLSDIVMDGMGGRELVWRLREMYPEIDIILASGYADEDTALQMMDDEGLTFIPKPIDFGFLLGKVKSILGSPSPEE
jgi:two-component system, cell cycle sensor histidine kinase and response regulator CckA